MKYVAPRWVEEKMTVIAPFQGIEASDAVRTTLGVKCSVIVAAGNHARVINEKHNVDRWLHIDDLRVPEGDPHA
jgi:hypothetical protein